jgi:sodium-dependent phosphate cotransporter
MTAEAAPVNNTIITGAGPVPVPPPHSRAARKIVTAEVRAEILPRHVRILGWVGVAALIYLLIAAVSIISRGFSTLSGGAAESLFAFAANPWVGLFVGVLATVLIQSSTTTTAIAVTAVGAGVLPLSGAIPIMLGANVGTTVTTTLIALGYIHQRDEYRRALAASSIHDFYNWLALAIFFPLELMFQPLERLSGVLTSAMYGMTWLPDPGDFNVIRTVTRPVVNLIADSTYSISNGNGAGAAFLVVLGAVLIFASVKYLSKLLKILMVGGARDMLTRTAGGNQYVAMATGMGATVITQSSTITTSVLIPFAGAKLLTTKQLYPVTVGANIGTTFTVVFAAFTLVGGNAQIGLQAAFVHLLYNIFSMVVIYMIPVLRDVPLKCAEWLAEVATDRKWVIATYLVGAFIALPLGVIMVAALN